MVISDPEDEFNRNVGKILQAAMNTEHNLDYFLASYFVKPKSTEKNFFTLASEKMGFFTDSILNQLEFEQKIVIIQDICKKKGDPPKLKETLTAIRFIQNTRNKVAHWEVRRNKEEMYLVKKDYFEENPAKFKLDEELMTRINDARIKISSGLTLDLFDL